MSPTVSREDVILREIAEILWPKGDIDHEWTADELTRIAGWLERGGYMPDPSAAPAARRQDAAIRLITLIEECFGYTPTDYTVDSLVAALEEAASLDTLDLEVKMAVHAYTQCTAWHGDLRCLGPKGHPGAHQNNDTHWGTIADTAAEALAKLRYEDGTTQAVYAEAPTRATFANPFAYERGTPSADAPIPDHLDDHQKRARCLLPYWLMDGIARLDDWMMLDSFDHAWGSIDDYPQSPSHSWYFLRTRGLPLLVASQYGVEHIGLLLHAIDLQDNASTDYVLTALRDSLTTALVTSLLGVSHDRWQQIAERLGFRPSAMNVAHEDGPDEQPERGQGVM